MPTDYGLHSSYLMAGIRSLIVASEYDPFSIVEKLSPYLAGSASIVVQSPHVQVGDYHIVMEFGRQMCYRF